MDTAKSNTLYVCTDGLVHYIFSEYIYIYIYIYIYSNNDIFELKGIQFHKVQGSISHQNKVS